MPIHNPPQKVLYPYVYMQNRICSSARTRFRKNGLVFLQQFQLCWVIRLLVCPHPRTTQNHTVSHSTLYFFIFRNTFYFSEWIAAAPIRKRYITTMAISLRFGLPGTGKIIGKQILLRRRKGNCIDLVAKLKANAT